MTTIHNQKQMLLEIYQRCLYWIIVRWYYWYYTCQGKDPMTEYIRHCKQQQQKYEEEYQEAKKQVDALEEIIYAEQFPWSKDMV